MSATEDEIICETHEMRNSLVVISRDGVIHLCPIIAFSLGVGCGHLGHHNKGETIVKFVLMLLLPFGLNGICALHRVFLYLPTNELASSSWS